MKYKLSVHCICYNQSPYIRQTLDGFIMQKTNFPFQVFVGDDASTDDTAKIINEYAEKYPDIIKPVLREKNVGVWENLVDLADRIDTEYVAMCEGDDYWTDPLKLQKQVDFMDANKDCSVCFHPVIVKWEDGSKPDKVFPSSEQRMNKDRLTLADLFRMNFIQTNSVIYRWRFGGAKKLRSILPSNILPLDYFIHLLHAQKGDICFLPDVMAVYRKWSGGIWNGAGVTDEWFVKCGLPHLNFYKEASKLFKTDFEIQIQSLLDLTKRAAKRLGRQDILSSIRKERKARRIKYFISNLKQFFYKSKITSSGKRLIKICKIPVYNGKLKEKK